ncbi:TPA: hypothetical protein JBF29_04245 [Legionella pneumophila]|nr:hypothetical protein [Legionella pneumophila]
MISWKANTQRDDHIRLLQDEGDMVWQKKNNYGLRSHIELAILRYKKIMGTAMKARELPQQKNRMWDCYACFKRITSLGMPVSVKVK